MNVIQKFLNLFQKKSENKTVLYYISIQSHMTLMYWV